MCHSSPPVRSSSPISSFLTRGGGRFESLGYIDEQHPLFNSPHTIGLERLNADWKGDEQWPGRFVSWWTLQKTRPAAILAAHDADRIHPWCVEIGWGRGRCLFFSCSPDRVPETQPEAARRICDALLENTLHYAAAVREGDPHPLPEDALIADDRVEEQIYLRPFSRDEEKAFEVQVNASVDRGVAWLLGKQKDDGSWGNFSDGWSFKYESGLTALSLLALMNSWVSKHKTPVEKGFEYLLVRRPRQTYEIAFCLMALEMKAAPMLERFRVARLDPAERKDYEYERTLTPDEKSYMHDLVELLTAAKGRGGNWRYNLEHSQTDISNGQFAVLGLKAASRCGLKVPTNIWEEILEYFLEYQAKEGPKSKYKEFQRFTRTDTPEFRIYPARQRGWSYGFGYADPAKTVGSHVNIGISCLLLSYEELAQRRAAVATNNRGAVRQAVRDGLAWLDAHWAIESRPNSSKVYYHYYIYSLGRVGTLIDKRFIGAHDWYREGVIGITEGVIGITEGVIGITKGVIGEGRCSCRKIAGVWQTRNSTLRPARSEVVRLFAADFSLSEWQNAQLRSRAGQDAEGRKKVSPPPNNGCPFRKASPTGSRSLRGSRSNPTRWRRRLRRRYRRWRSRPCSLRAGEGCSKSRSLQDR